MLFFTLLFEVVVISVIVMTVFTLILIRFGWIPFDVLPPFAQKVFRFVSRK